MNMNMNMNMEEQRSSAGRPAVTPYFAFKQNLIYHEKETLDILFQSLFIWKSLSALNIITLKCLSGSFYLCFFCSFSFLSFMTDIILYFVWCYWERGRFPRPDGRKQHVASLLLIKNPPERHSDRMQTALWAMLTLWTIFIIYLNVLACNVHLETQCVCKWNGPLMNISLCVLSFCVVAGVSETLSVCEHEENNNNNNNNIH